MSAAYMPPEWTERALCAEIDTELFFPEKGGSTREPKGVCASCDVRAECLDYALANNERFGIWGGKSERERRRLTHAIPDTDLTVDDYDTADDFTYDLQEPA